MVICLFGENCTGKSSIADVLSARLNATLITGKDYLRLAKSEAEAKRAFAALLSERLGSDQALVYVASDPEQLALLPTGVVRVLITAELPRIKERFAARMGGKLPAPVEAMLERKHGMFDELPCELLIHTEGVSAESAAGQILSLLSL